MVQHSFWLILIGEKISTKLISNYGQRNNIMFKIRQENCEEIWRHLPPCFSFLGPTTAWFSNNPHWREQYHPTLQRKTCKCMITFKGGGDTFNIYAPQHSLSGTKGHNLLAARYSNNTAEATIYATVPISICMCFTTLSLIKSYFTVQRPILCDKMTTI